jgi:dihydroflavonol-4-reductase
MDRVLLTGISGFLGGHIALSLLTQGYAVRGSVRSQDKAKTMWKALALAGADIAQLETVQLDLLSDAGWEEAARDCHFLIHAASPFVTIMPKDPEVLIRPAVDGTRRAIHAALAAGHKRIILTSSLAAVHSGWTDYQHVFTEEDWTDLSGPLVSAYAASKTLAEQEAWHLVKEAGVQDRLAVINPAAILGPLLDDDPGTSAAILLEMLRGKLPMLPDIILEYVDVRDVAAAHVAALNAPQAGGQRHILADASLSLMEIATILRSRFPGHCTKLPKTPMPGWLARLVALMDQSLRDARPFLGIRKQSRSARGIALLGKNLIPAKNAVIATAASMIERGMV